MNAHARARSRGALLILLLTFPAGVLAQDAANSPPITETSSIGLQPMPTASPFTVAPRTAFTGKATTAALALSPGASAGTSGPEGMPPAPDVRDLAEDFRGEVGFGIAYANLSLLGFTERRNSVGWGANLAINLSRYVAFEADFGGQYDPECSQNDPECIIQLLTSTTLVDYSSYQFMAGPRFNVPGDRFSGFLHVLVGGVRSDVTLFNTVTSTLTEIDDGPNFAMALGGGLNWNLDPRFAWRLVQVDYIPVHRSAEWRHNVRIQSGIVFRFGRRGL
jgi:opacity protein-like surface antigen